MHRAADERAEKNGVQQVEGWDAGQFGHLIAAAIGIAGSAVVGLWYRRRRGVAVLAPLAGIGLGAMLAARAAFVLQHYASYSGRPWSLLDIADGGFSAAVGLFTALVLGAESTRRLPAARRPLVVAGVTGIAAWAIGTVALAGLTPARVSVPVMEAQRLDGTPVQLRGFTRKPMVLNLWATWCAPCRREMPVLAGAQRRHPDIAFVFLNQQEEAAAIATYLAGEGLRPDNVLIDPAGEVARKTGAFAYPTTLFFDGEGVLVMRHVGELSGSALEQRLATLRRTGRGKAPVT